jgi:homoserine dehydrogenase
MSSTTPSPKRIRLILAGLGNVGRNFLRILQTQADVLRDRYGVQFVVVGAADSTGAAIDANGINLADAYQIKRNRQPIATLPGAGRLGLTALQLVQELEADMVLEATPVNLQHGQPGLDIARTALQRGLHCVLANKGPLALAYQELAALSDLSPSLLPSRSSAPHLRFSACVGGALPTINIGWRDLAGARITRIEAMVNGTCQGILRMMEGGASFEAALAQMQARGIVEADPSLDIDGWDEAVKLVIIANAVLRRPTTLSDLTVSGIRQVTQTDLQQAASRHERLVLLGTAEPHTGDWAFAVRVVPLPMAHPLARMSGDEMGVVYETDIAGTICATSAETDATPTAAAMLRDVLEIVRAIK